MLAEAPALQGTEGSRELAMAGDAHPLAPPCLEALKRSLLQNPSVPEVKIYQPLFARQVFRSLVLSDLV
jgi:hypothetical protein